jgi:hypothetical protein
MKTAPGYGLLVIERILRDRQSIWRQIIEERDLRSLTGQMLASSTASLACYGIVLGASNGWAQALSSMVKLPLLFLATLTICLPTLYLFNLVFGARLSMMQAVTLILVSITVTAVLTLAFAPISLFFLISAHSYSFFKLLNVCILVLTAVVGLRFLTAGMGTLNEHQIELATAAMPRSPVPVTDTSPSTPIGPQVAEPVAHSGAQPEAAPTGAVAAATPNGGMAAPTGAPVAMLLAAPEQLRVPVQQPAIRPLPRPYERPNSMTLLYIWILLFGFVGTQLAWTLRPFFGSPGEPFALFRHLNGTFYGDIFSTIGRLLHG